MAEIRRWIYGQRQLARPRSARQKMLRRNILNVEPPFIFVNAGVAALSPRPLIAEGFLRLRSAPTWFVGFPTPVKCSLTSR